ncbi:MAG: EamA family transporter [Thermotogota bacterium]|nr:EamA family transporter [Thermotogota bacterium]
MTYLILAILCSSSIALIFKFSETSNMNRFLVTTSNYLIAFTTSLILIFVEGTPWSFFSFWLGSLAGVFFFLSFYLYQRSVRESGASLSGAFGKMGILIPMILSVIIWNEMPALIQWIGIGLALLSIILVNLPSKREKKTFHIDLIFLFVFGGMAEFFNKIFQKYAVQSSDKNVFLFFVFFSAFIISLSFSLLKRNRKKFKIKDFLTGLAVGVPNLFSSFFLIMSLDYIKTAVVFPIYSAGSIMLITLASTIFFGEKLKVKEKLSIVVTIIALILVNL